VAEEITITRYQGVTASGYDRVLAFMRDQLLSGRLKTGDRLLSERDLANALGVSRPVVREALRALAALGAVEIQRGQGTVVRKPDFSALADFFGFVLAQQTDAVDDVMEVRIAIERQAIRVACKRALASDLENVARAFEHIVKTMDDPVAGGAADFHFHTTIVEAARSPTLSSVYAAVANLLERSHMERRKQIMNVEGIDSFLIDHHAAILKALQNRDADRADALLADHFEIGADFRRRAHLLHAVKNKL
jgi:DNA-binding FadR family transcriptional regulator